jgi:hypothetical protein
MKTYPEITTLENMIAKLERMTEGQDRDSTLAIVEEIVRVSEQLRCLRQFERENPYASCAK